MCHLCERLGYRWTLCQSCGIEFPFQAAEQLSTLKAVRMDAAGGMPWYVEGHVPDWLIPSMVWTGVEAPTSCFRCDPSGWREAEG